MKKLSKIIMTIAACVTLFGSAAVSVSNPISACGHQTNCGNADDEWCCIDLDTKNMRSMTSKREKKNSTSVYFNLLGSECKIIYISVYGSKSKNGEYKNRTCDNYGRECDHVTILPAAESAREFQIYNHVNERWDSYCELRGQTNYKRYSANISFYWSPDTCSAWGTPSTVAHG